ncbi:hypothetical protein CTEN210_12679 [Chaetoceros tenuissimus]|uniref:Uncharacterized protein n=1 Tax=Chaetoceros tenuissimus TaxID=426638 RepID=A0AAD3D206_9STRA|nr:hypothetical protein CTEN210_12679 [Chaetoceros tenuissimus]
MPVSDIIYIISTVSITQAILEIGAKKFVFDKEGYKSKISALERARIRKDRTLALPAPQNTNSKSNAKAAEKYMKKIKQAEDDYNMAASAVAQKHMAPRILGSFVFLILYRILNTEYQGKIVALLPYEPWGIIRYFSMRGLNFSQDFSVESVASDQITSVNQACSFLFLYALCNMSVKFVVTQLLGKKAPPGVDRGILSFIDDPRGQKILEELGVNTAEIDEMKKALK